ncbi:MAG: type II toxin-antitoxin system Phd/YefM family antitoxin [Myxococcaceae bacterium]|nr:type II toxin-antitoxin system Phd/YefM family antitoxin [Myxococcaceae bacterium]
MPLTTRDVIPLSHARANLSELADEVRAGAEKVITKNGESYVALIAADRLDYYHRLAAERWEVELLQDVQSGLDDIAAGRVKDARKALTAIKARRSRRSRR